MIKERIFSSTKTVDQVIRENRNIKGTNIGVAILDSNRGVIKYEGTLSPCDDDAQIFFNCILK